MKATTAYQAFVNSPFPCSKHSSYFEIYEELFSKFKGQPITFVEIGVLNGGSLFMWRNFFGRQARIIGIDLNPEAKKWEAEGFEIFIGSQANPTFWRHFFNQVGRVDVVLDDGGHTYLQQVLTAEMCLAQINDGGLLVVEDTHTSYMEGFGNRAYSFLSYTKAWLDKINCRSSFFKGNQRDSRVWSAEIFESIVAFKVNRLRTQVRSEPIDNPASKVTSNLVAKDYRNALAGYTKADEEEINRLLTRAFSVIGT